MPFFRRLIFRYLFTVAKFLPLFEGRTETTGVFLFCSSGFSVHVSRIRNVYPGSPLLIFIHPRSLMADFGSGIQQEQQRGGRKKLVVGPIFVATNITRKNLSQFTKNYIVLFTQEIATTKLLEIWVWDPGSGNRNNLFRIQDPEVKKDPGSGSATLLLKLYLIGCYHSGFFLLSVVSFLFGSQLSELGFDCTLPLSQLPV